MEEREIQVHSDLEGTIRGLIAYRERGEQVFCRFNGHILHSRNVTMDSGYLEVTGYTKEEYQAELKRLRAATLMEDEREKKEAEIRIPEWIERGKKLVSPDLYAEWEQRVKKSARGFYNGFDIENALEIMEVLSSGDIDKAFQIIEAQNHSGASYEIVRAIVTKFSPKGYLFWEKTNRRYERMTPRNTLEKTVAALLEAHREGRLMYCEFNGHILLSDTVNIEKAFIEVVGMTKEEYDKALKEHMAQYERERLEDQKRALARIPDLIEQGKPYIYPERLNDWKDCVEKVSTGLYGDHLVDNALEVMAMLDKGASIDECKEVLDRQNHSGGSLSLLRAIILRFSKRGPEMFRETALFEIDADDKEIIDSIEKENESLDRAHREEGPKLA